MLVTEVTILRLTSIALGAVLIVLVAALIALRLGSPRELSVVVGAVCGVVIAAAIAVAAKLEGNMGAQRVAEAMMFAATAAVLGFAGHVAIQAAGVAGARGEYTTMVLQFSVLITAYGVLIPNPAPRALVGSALLATVPLAMVIVSAELLPIGEVVGPLVMLALAILVSGAAAFLIASFRKLAVETRVLNMYDLTERIGEGGMGEVWKAEHRRLRRPAAIKLIRSDLLGSDAERAERAMARFELEAKTTANLRSPNTVEVYDFGTTSNGTFFYVMEYLDGVDLESLIEDHGPVPPGRVVHILGQVCASIADAHEHGLIHRDIKPANICLSRLGLAFDYVKVLDFGLVKPLDAGADGAEISSETVVTGTPAYMPPEMVTGDAEVDERADIYAIGCVAYWLLTGQLVFEESNAMKMAVAHATYPPVPPSKRTEMEIPEALERVVLRCIEKAPDDRYRTARELSAALEACELGDSWTPDAAEEWWLQSKSAESVIR